MSARFSQILKVIAQQATTEQSVIIPGNPTAFDPYVYWPTITTGWGAQNTTTIKQISNILNWSIYVLSQGQLDINKLRGTNFVVDTSKYPDRILTLFVKAIQQFYRLIYTDLGETYTSVIQNAPQRLQILKGALAVLPDGGINQYLSNKIGGNPKSLMLNLLDQIR